MLSKHTSIINGQTWLPLPPTLLSVSHDACHHYVQYLLYVPTMWSSASQRRLQRRRFHTEPRPFSSIFSPATKRANGHHSQTLSLAWSPAAPFPPRSLLTISTSRDSCTGCQIFLVAAFIPIFGLSQLMFYSFYFQYLRFSTLYSHSFNLMNYLCCEMFKFSGIALRMATIMKFCKYFHGAGQCILMTLDIATTINRLFIYTQKYNITILTCILHW